MSGTASAAGNLLPPANETPLAGDGQHTLAWGQYFRGVSDRLVTLPAAMRKGVVDGSDAAAGDIGEYVEDTAGGVALVSAATTNVVSLDLTAGDWDVQGNVVFSAGSGTHNLFAAGVGGLDTFISATFPSAAIDNAITTMTHRYNLTAATTVWVVGMAVFAGTVSATGTIRARRAR